jgi:hypothetical protein
VPRVFYFITKIVLQKRFAISFLTLDWRDINYRFVAVRSPFLFILVSRFLYIFFAFFLVYFYFYFYFPLRSRVLERLLVLIFILLLYRFIFIFLFLESPSDVGYRKKVLLNYADKSGFDPFDPLNWYSQPLDQIMLFKVPFLILPCVSIKCCNIFFSSAAAAWLVCGFLECAKGRWYTYMGEDRNHMITFDFDLNGTIIKWGCVRIK